MFHGPAEDCGPDYSEAYKTRLGVIMCIIYTVLMVGFVAINVVKPSLWSLQIIFGQNLAVVYGVGLIIFALVLALIYNHLCTKHEKMTAAAHQAKESK